MSDTWFHCRDLSTGTAVVLEGREARHAAGARRLSIDDQVTLFDGRGAVAQAKIMEVDRRNSLVKAKVGDVERRLPLKPSMHLACALAKGDRQATLLSMATQLGMSSFTPLLCERSVVKPGKNFAERAERICIQACKQCQQPHCPAIHPAATLSAFLDSRVDAAARAYLFHPDGRPPHSTEPALAERVTLLIGPEGGFAPQETELAQRQGVTIVSMGSLLMRIETAAVAALAWCRFAALQSASHITSECSRGERSG